MSFFTVKTAGFQTAGLKFRNLKDKLDKQVKKEKLGQDAQLRFTVGKGLYAKSGTWNVSGNAPFGSGVVLRGNKFLAARAEIARSINLAYGNFQINGELIGDYVVDQVLEARARQQLGLAPEDVGDRRQIENRKGTLYLKVSDLAQIEAKIKEIKQKSRPSRRRKVQPQLASSVGYIRGVAQTGAAAEKGTQMLIDAVADDIAAHRWAKMDAKKLDKLSDDDRNEAYHKIYADAEAEARRLLRRHGMRTFNRGHMENEREIHVLEGGLTASNIADIRSSLHRKGVDHRNVSALLQATQLPRHINNCGDRLNELKQQVEKSALALLQNPIHENIALDVGSNRMNRNSGSFHEVFKAIKKAADENRSIILDLKKMSYPEDLNNTDLRQEKYNQLIENIERMDQSLVLLNGHLRDSTQPFNEGAVDAISNLVDVTQQFCLETLELAGGIHPMLPASDTVKKRELPFRVRLPGLMAFRSQEGGIRVGIKNGLAGEIKAPDSLFQSDSTGRSSIRTMIKQHNALIGKIHDQCFIYLDLIEQGKRNFGPDDRAFVNKYRDRLLRAIWDNERLTQVMQRRQKILGQNLSQELNGEIQRAKAQRQSLLHLLYPRLTHARRGQNVSAILARQAPGKEPLLSGANGSHNIEESRGHAAGRAVNASSPNARPEQMQPHDNIGQQELSPDSALDNIGIERGLAFVDDIDVQNVNHVEFDLESIDYYPWRQIEDSARADAVFLTKVHNESSLWLDELNSNEFKKAESLSKGQRPLYEITKDSIENNEAAVGYMNFRIEHDDLFKENNQNTVQKKLWASLEDLLKAKERLVAFIEMQRNKISSGEFDNDLNAKQLAQENIEKVQTTLVGIEKLITVTHSAAYTLTPHDRPHRVENGMKIYPPTLAVTFNPKNVDRFHIDGKNHDVALYSDNENIGRLQQPAGKVSISSQQRTKDYQESLNAIHKSLNNVAKVMPDVHRQRRMLIVDQQLIPTLDNALNKNTDVMIMFKDKDFQNDVLALEILTKDQIGEIINRLAQDRLNIEQLRLETFVLLHRDALQENAA
ncbi:MAG: hypothetical protein AAF936_08770 [Pseudomonadota bacterium]